MLVSSNRITVDLSTSPLDQWLSLNVGEEGLYMKAILRAQDEHDSEQEACEKGKRYVKSAK